MEKSNRPFKETALFIGNMRYLDIKKKTISTVDTYIEKRLHTSNKSTWENTLALLKDLNKTGHLTITFLDLSRDLVFLSTLDDFSDLWKDIFQEITKSKCLILINNYFCDELRSGERIWLHYPSAEKYVFNNLFIDIPYENRHKEFEKLIKKSIPSMQRIIEEVINSGFKCIPYDNQEGTFEKILEVLNTINPIFIFRIYVPNGHYKEGLITDFLKLFEDYMRNVLKTSFMVDQSKSEHATVFIFKSDKKISQGALEISFEKFYSFLNIEQNEIQTMKDDINKAEISQNDAERLKSKYIAAYDRMLLDFRHEYERRRLILKQKLDTEIFDALPMNQSNQGTENNQNLFDLLPQNKEIININFYNQPVFDNQTHQHIYEEVFYGGIKNDLDDNHILQLIEKYSKGIEAVSLASEYNILKEKSQPPDRRKIAWDKIKNFLSKVTPIISEKAIEFAFEIVKRKYLS
jgi:hypothetical protein